VLADSIDESPNFLNIDNTINKRKQNYGVATEYIIKFNLRRVVKKKKSKNSKIIIKYFTFLVTEKKASMAIKY